MMKFFLAAILIAIAEAGVITGDSNCVIVRNANYEKEILKNDVQSPYQLAIDHDTNTLFFSFTARKEEMFKSAYLSLKTGEYDIVSGIRGGFANAVNSKSGIVYMGGEDGVYQFNYNTKSAINLHIKDVNIWQMFYKDGLYFTTYPDEAAYFYNNNQVAEVPEVKQLKVLILAVNNDKHLVYSNSSGVFMYSNAKDDAILLNNAVANGFTSDVEGNLYFSASTAIYFINDKTKTAEELIKMDNIYGAAIESNGNIIYATEESIIRLKPSKKVCLDENQFAKNFIELDP